MKDDYLWDKTGEPDPEIQQLEQVLGILRYRPQPLEIPVGLQINRKRSIFPGFAIAAAIAATIFAVGLWTALNRQPTESRAGSTAAHTTPAATDSNPKALTSPEVPRGNNQVVSSVVNERNATQQPIPQSHRRRNNSLPRRMLAGTLTPNSTRGRHLPEEGPELTASERLEAEAAKEQLLLALRVASSKLSLAQRKAQGTYPTNLIRNQHKVG